MALCHVMLLCYVGYGFVGLWVCGFVGLCEQVSRRGAQWKSKHHIHSTRVETQDSRIRQSELRILNSGLTPFLPYAPPFSAIFLPRGGLEVVLGRERERERERDTEREVCPDVEVG